LITTQPLQDQAGPSLAHKELDQLELYFRSRVKSPNVQWLILSSDSKMSLIVMQKNQWFYNQLEQYLQHDAYFQFSHLSF
jgi:hypothetical protein